MKPNDPTTYTLTLRALPGNWQSGPERRLRALLKAILRCWGFRVTDIKVPNGTPQDQAAIVPIRVLGPAPEVQPATKPATPPALRVTEISGNDAGGNKT